MQNTMTIANSPIQTFSDSQILSHPAVSTMLGLLESLSKKSLKDFATFFGSCDFHGFFANLPGAVKIRDPKLFIEKHKTFFDSKVTSFVYGPLKDGIGNEDFLMASIQADVTIPDGSQRQVHIDLTLIRNKDKNPFWIPIRFINTVIDKKQAVLHN